jgi:outer membrane protein assembly factor BamB
VAVSAVTGRLYVAYQDVSGTGIIYCLNVYDDTIVWNGAVTPGVDRLAINRDGQLLYVPTWEGGSADFINIVDANTGDVVRKVHFSNRSHDTQYPLSGPVSKRRRPTTEAALPVSHRSGQIFGITRRASSDLMQWIARASTP